MEYLLTPPNAQPSRVEPSLGQPLESLRAMTLRLPSEDGDARPGRGPSRADAIDDLLTMDWEAASLKTSAAAKQTRSRVQILDHNLEQILLNQVKLENQLLELVGQTWSSGLRDKTVRAVESDWLSLERDRRMELVSCWRDLRDLEFAFLNYHSEAKNASSLAELTGDRRVVPADRPSAFLPASSPPASSSVAVPAHGPRYPPAVGRLRDVSSLEACLR